MGKIVGLVFKSVENAPKEPTIAELKEKATALGLTFAGNISKANLTALIEEAEKVPETPEETTKETTEVVPDGEE